MLLGDDVSQFQSVTPNLSGLSFLFIRATIGLQVDTKYSMHFANSRKAGLQTNAYHYGNTSESIPAQVALFLSTAKQADLLALDVEAGNLTPTQAIQFISLVHAAGRKIGLYHSLSSYPRNYGQDFDWVAAWGSSLNFAGWEFWQYRGSPLDLDEFYGNQSQLINLQGQYGEKMGLAVQFGTLRGTANIKGPGHSIVRVSDGHWVAAADGSGCGIVIAGKLLTPLPGGLPGADRSSVYIFNTEPAPNQQLYIVLQSDVTFVPAPPPVDDDSLNDPTVKALVDNQVALAVAPLKQRLAAIDRLATGT